MKKFEANLQRTTKQEWMNNLFQAQFMKIKELKI